MSASGKLLFLSTLFACLACGISTNSGFPTSIYTRLVHQGAAKLRGGYDIVRPQSNIEARLRLRDSPVFFVEFYASNRSVPEYAAMDTATQLLWIRCIPCPGCDVTGGQVFDPRASSTYMNLPCDTPSCDLADGACDSNNKCMYSVEYRGETYSLGYLARETLSFETDDEGLLRVPSVVFGCSHNDMTYRDKVMPGVFGLGYHNLSLAVRFGKFSYCVGRIGDPSYEYNQLVLGEGAVFEGDSTPLKFDGWRYYVTLEGISLGGAMLDIPSSTFAFRKRTPRKQADGVILDSGSPVTLLVEDAYSTVRSNVKDMMPLPSMVDGIENRLCFYGVADRDTKGFPTLTLHFAGGAELALEPDGLFFQRDDRWFCMTIEESLTSYSTIGMYAQQHYNVGYDIAGKKIYFQRMDCQLLS